MTQLNRIRKFEARMRLATGLHIGAGSDEMHIGGVDLPVVRHPLSGEPYIPGSSIKGKMRSLLEWRAGVVGESSGAPVSARVLHVLASEPLKHAAAMLIARGFGIAGDSGNADLAEKLGPSRFGFWDCELTRDWIEERICRGELFTETKSENVINRITGTAEHPRNTERVPAGATFHFRLNVKEIGDADNEMVDLAMAGLKLLELDGIGGSGSRGYGKIVFDDLSLDGESIDEQFSAFDPFSRQE